eukprot:768441-Hanusia_phi.AAC.9
MSYPQVFARCTVGLANLYDIRGPAGKRYKQVMPDLNRSLSTIVRIYGRQHAMLYHFLQTYESVCERRCMPQHVRFLQEWIIEILTINLGQNSDHVDTAKIRLITILIKNEDFQRARALLDEQLARKEAVYGNTDERISQIILEIVDLEMLAAERNQNEQQVKNALSNVIPLLQRSLSIKLKVHSQPRESEGAFNLACCPELKRLARVHSLLLDWKNCEYHISRAVELLAGQLKGARDAFARISPHQQQLYESAGAEVRMAALELAHGLRLQGSFMAEKGSLPSACEAYQRAHALLQGELGGEHPQCEAIRATLASLHRAQKAYTQAQKLF